MFTFFTIRAKTHVHTVIFTKAISSTSRLIGRHQDKNFTGHNLIPGHNDERCSCELV